MTAFVFSPVPQATVAVHGSDKRFPVRRIFCVGRNYAAHAREMGKDPDRDPPFFFTKPADAVVDSGETVAYPPDTADFHYEAELVVAIGKAGKDISEANAESYVWGYAVGNDLTRRDLQLKAREQGRPWDMGKAFDRSAVIGPVFPVEALGHPRKGAICLTVNGAVKQSADLADLIWSVPEIIAFLSRSISLERGDLIMTGTPAGVGPLAEGDLCVASIEGLGAIETPIGPRER
ncbi:MULTISPECIES: fumarylacetoacetate hydrolase family protein [Rhizobium/Agrobacterium group]|uniref:fumarylacetoacetate hydrolase family protein n=1 Tax=Rhizobium/Agrobacterium group TaxID=227290 RepID=UPI0022B8377D|nr:MULTISPECIES: fumarylacetoacetate hydrolase family protein [Rhizobium/Agrobacterium group]MCZ7889956.1 fumarylacetoacetate hydrolase family protein [Agrobacterium salinitolerans]MDA5636457.1 fumarylacetoacetate hydrolase family protein [Agrobacterium sp. ST15.16.024]MDF1892327.1 fumarylacetoacetate hydrolase family protein [Rhizobium rhizogenes]